MPQDLGAPKGDGLAGAEAPEPPSRLGPSDGIPSAAHLGMANRLEGLRELQWSDVGPLNDAIHDLAPNPKVIQPPDYVRSLDAVEHFSFPWAAAHTRWNPDAWRWECQLENSLGIPFEKYQGHGETEQVARLAAYLRAHAAQGTEARRAETGNTDSVHESAVPAGNAPKPSPISSDKPIDEGE